MSMWQEREPRTRMFARVVGPFIAAVMIIAALRDSEMALLVSQFTASAVAPLVTGAFILLGGIAIVAFHQYWRSPAEVVVSVLGWLLVLRGVILLAFPAAVATMADRMMGWHATVIALYVVMAMIGLYLTFIGYRTHQAEPVADADTTAKHLRHAA